MHACGRPVIYFSVMNDGFDFNTVNFTAFQTFADERKVDVEALLPIEIELFAATEYFKDHGHDVSYVHIAVGQTFLKLFIFLFSL